MTSNLRLVKGELPRWYHCHGLSYRGECFQLGNSSFDVQCNECSSDRLLPPTGEHVRALAAHVIYHVEGPEVSKIVVGLAVADQKDPRKKKKLEAAIPLVKDGAMVKPKAR